MSNGTSAAEAEVLYSKAARAELGKEYDDAFALYVRAAQAYVDLARKARGEQERRTWTNGATKCMKRAEQIKEAKKDLKPLVRNPFSEAEQAHVLERSARVNGLRYAVWNGWGDEDLDTSCSNQPSLGPALSAKAPSWRRPQDVFSSVSMASPELLPDQVLQNSVTDCSVCSSIVVCLQHQRMFRTKTGLECLYPQNPDGVPQLSSTGKYVVRFCINGAYRKIAIDDNLPFYPNGKPISVSTTPEFDLWPSLVEKAYMTVMGGYDFPGSNSSKDIHAITGWIPEHLEIKSPTFESEKAWTRIYQNFIAGRCILTVGTGQRDSSRLQQGDTKLLPTHSYAVIDVREESGDRWLIILNPWDGSTNSTGEGLETAFENLRLQERSTATNIDWDDVCIVFDGIYLNWNPSFFPYHIDFHGYWKPKSEATTSQSTHHHIRFSVFDASKGDEVCVLLTRHYVDKSRSGEYIAVQVQQEETTSGPAAVNRQVSLRGTYTSSTHVLARHALEDSTGQFAVIASYDGQYDDVCFTVQVFSTARLEWITEQRKPMYSQSVSNVFSSANAGGNYTYPTFMNNPQYRIHIHTLSDAKARSGTSAGHTGVSRPGTDTRTAMKATVRVVVQGPRNTPLNVAIVWSKGERVFQLNQGDVLADSGPYSYGVAHAGASLTPGDYTVVVSAFEPKHRGSFTLLLESSARFELEQVPMEGAGMFSKPVKGAWELGSDGGSPRFGQYSKNPIFLLETRNASTVKIRLQLAKPSPAIALNVTLFASSTIGTAAPSSPPSLGAQMATSGPYADSIAGVVTPLVTLQPGKYVLVVSTYDPGIHAQFVLTVMAGKSDVKVQAIS